MSNAVCFHCGHVHDCSAPAPKVGVVTRNSVGDMVITYGNTFPTDGTVDK